MSFTFLVMVILGGLMLTVGVKYISKMATSIMGLSGETSDTMRDQILQQLKEKNEKVMLSVPTIVEMTRKENKRAITVAIANKNPTKKCFCINPHLLLLTKDTVGDIEKMNSMRDNPDATIRQLSSDVQSKIKRYVPPSCFEPGFKCNPNGWFQFQPGIEIQGKDRDAIVVQMEIPKTSERAPNGKWALKVDVCIFHNKQQNPDGSYEQLVPCEACIPDMCTSSASGTEPNDDPENENAYEWYASRQFFVRLK